MSRRSRRQVAEDHGISRYAVDRIREPGGNRRKLAERFGITRYAVDKIRSFFK
jgi:hypothetical protein